MRVGMLDRVALPEPAGGGQRRFHFGVRVEDLLAPHHLDIIVEAAGWTDGGIHLQPVSHPRRVVVRAVPRRRVYRSGALFEGDVVGQNRDRVALVQGVLEAQSLQVATFEAHQLSAEVSADRVGHRARQLLGHDHRCPIDVIDAVVEARLKCHRKVRGNRPGRGCPDQHRHGQSRQGRHPFTELQSALGPELEFHVDRRRGVVLVLDLRFCQRGAAA